MIHTDAIKNIIVPTITQKQKKFIYSEEADVLNVALFGMTAKDWKLKNPKLAHKGNIRDYTDLLHLVILNNIAKKQMELLKNNTTFKNLEYIENEINNNSNLLTEKNKKQTN